MDGVSLESIAGWARFALGNPYSEEARAILVGKRNFNTGHHLLVWDEILSNHDGGATRDHHVFVCHELRAAAEYQGSGLEMKSSSEQGGSHSCDTRCVFRVSTHARNLFEVERRAIGISAEQQVARRQTDEPLPQRAVVANLALDIDLYAESPP
jgi:hypothetical protein